MENTHKQFNFNATDEEIREYLNSDEAAHDKIAYDSTDEVSMRTNQDEETLCWGTAVWLKGRVLVHATQLQPTPAEALQAAINWLDESEYKNLRRFED